jgi:hypothetical protein
MHRSLSFAMHQIFFQTKRSYSATNRPASSRATTSIRTLLVADEERECVGGSRVARRQRRLSVRVRRASVRKQALNESGPRAQQLSGRLTPFVVCAVRLHAKTPWRSESMFTLRADHGYECAHCDCLISWHRAHRLRQRFRKAGRFRARITLPTPFAAVPCDWCWRMT